MARPQIIKEQVPLAPLTTFKIGGVARFFCAAKHPDDTVAAYDWARAEGVPVFVLGEGSNILVSDAGFAGLVLKNEDVNFQLDGTELISGAGVHLGYLVEQCAENGLQGAQYLVGIPGTVGGAVRGNAGAWGHDISELITSVDIFDSQQRRLLPVAQCKFSYRESVIKHQPYTILAAHLHLTKGIKTEVQAAMRDYMTQRAARHPIEPSAGSVFKNIIVSELSDPERVRHELGASAAEYEELTKYGKLAAGALIDRFNLRGKKIGGAQVSPRHGNIIINAGGATAKDVLELINLVKEQVRERMNIQLQAEIEFVGFNS